LTNGSLNSPSCSCVSITLPGLIVNANHGLPIHLAKLAGCFQDSAHENDNSPIKKFNEPLPFARFLLIALGWLALAPQARGACQEGCLTIRNTVLGDDAFFSNTTGFDNTANGFSALYGNTTGVHRSTKVCGCAPAAGN